MRTLNQLKQAIENRYVLRWNDPEPIEGNDYIINRVFLDKLEGVFDGDEDLDGVPILIHYGEGSEAEVFINEIVRLT